MHGSTSATLLSSSSVPEGLPGGAGPDLPSSPPLAASPVSLGIHASIASPPTLTLPCPDASNPDRLAATVYHPVVQRFAMQNTVRGLLPAWRVCACCRVPVAASVELYYHPEYSKATYGGLQTCASVHICPVCSTKIGERRKVEVQAGVSAWSETGGTLVLATFTLSHQAGDPLARLGAALNAAYRRLKAGKAWATFAAQYGLIGSICSREYTYGAAGWHPHLHALMFVRGGLSLRELMRFERWLQERWAAAISSLGEFASLLYGVDCRLGDQAAGDYLAKQGKGWTVADELVKGAAKGGRAGSRSIPRLLTDAAQGDEQAARLFVEFAEWSFRKNALVWSRGLRARLGLVEQEQSDEELAALQEAGGQLLIVFEREQWRVILGNDARGELLLVAAAGDVDRVVDFVRLFGVELQPWQFAIGGVAAPE